MSPKIFNQLPLKDRVGLFLNTERKVMEPIADYESYKADLYSVDNMTIIVLEYKENRHIIQAVAMENASESEVFSDCIYMG